MCSHNWPFDICAEPPFALSSAWCSPSSSSNSSSSNLPGSPATSCTGKTTKRLRDSKSLCRKTCMTMTAIGILLSQCRCRCGLTPQHQIVGQAHPYRNLVHQKLHHTSYIIYPGLWETIFCGWKRYFVCLHISPTWCQKHHRSSSCFSMTQQSCPRKKEENHSAARLNTNVLRAESETILGETSPATLDIPFFFSGDISAFGLCRTATPKLPNLNQQLCWTRQAATALFTAHKVRRINVDVGCIVCCCDFDGTLHPSVWQVTVVRLVASNGLHCMGVNSVYTGIFLQGRKKLQGCDLTEALHTPQKVTQLWADP